MFLPNSQSFLLVKSANPVRSSRAAILRTRAFGVSPVRGREGSQRTSTSNGTSATSNGARPVIQSGRNVFLPNSHSFLLVSSHTYDIGGEGLPSSPSSACPELPVLSHVEGNRGDSGKPPIRDKGKRTFLKAAGVAGISFVASLFLPKKSEALIMGSSPTTGVVGVKNAANTRINPATEETLDEVLKTTDLTFDAGSLKVKSFSDSGDVARSGLVDVDRHVQVDVLSSELPSSASTEFTLQTIADGGKRYALRLATKSTDPNIDYVGEAVIGATPDAVAWRIKEINSITGVTIKWAGTGTFNQIWDNRESLDYY